MTEDEFDRLAGSHPEREIREMHADMKALRLQLDREGDPVKAAALEEEIVSWAGFITSRMRDIGRDDDDLINDSVFHAQ